MKTIAILAAALALAGCETFPTRPTVVSEVRTIESPPTVIPAPCVDPADVPEPFVTSMPPGGDLKQRAAGADADLSWIVPRYAKARAKLIECSQLPKEEPK